MDTTETRKRSGKNAGRRRNRIVNPVFQWRYTLLISGSVFFVSAFMSVILFAVLHNQARARLVNPETSYMWENTLVMLLSAVVFSAVTAGAVGFWSIFLTHRVAGPLYVLQRYLREMSSGRMPSVRALRKKDEFKELHDTLREAVETLKNRHRADLGTLTEMLEVARSSADSDEKAKQDALEEIARRIEGLRAQAAEVLGEQPDDVPSKHAGSREPAPEPKPVCTEVHA